MKPNPPTYNSPLPWGCPGGQSTPGCADQIQPSENVIVDQQGKKQVVDESDNQPVVVSVVDSEKYKFLVVVSLFCLYGVVAIVFLSEGAYISSKDVNGAIAIRFLGSLTTLLILSYILFVAGRLIRQCSKCGFLALGFLLLLEWVFFWSFGSFAIAALLFWLTSILEKDMKTYS